jgi:hypothetical protein
MLRKKRGAEVEASLRNEVQLLKLNLHLPDDISRAIKRLNEYLEQIVFGDAESSSLSPEEMRKNVMDLRDRLLDLVGNAWSVVRAVPDDAQIDPAREQLDKCALHYIKSGLPMSDPTDGEVTWFFRNSIRNLISTWTKAPALLDSPVPEVVAARNKIHNLQRASLIFSAGSAFLRIAEEKRMGSARYLENQHSFYPMKAAELLKESLIIFDRYLDGTCPYTLNCIDRITFLASSNADGFLENGSAWAVIFDRAIGYWLWVCETLSSRKCNGEELRDAQRSLAGSLKRSGKFWYKQLYYLGSSNKSATCLIDTALYEGGDEGTNAVDIKERSKSGVQLEAENDRQKETRCNRKLSNETIKSVSINEGISKCRVICKRTLNEMINTLLTLDDVKDNEDIKCCRQFLSEIEVDFPCELN